MALVGRRLKRRMAAMTPVRVAERALDRARSSVRHVKDAIGDGRTAMAAREVELRHRLLENRSSSEPSVSDGSAVRQKR
jgi:hypothetical protein